MKVIFLGTNGWYDTKTGSTPSILIDSKEFYIFLDAGNGIYKADKFIKGKKPIYLFVSHFHFDHIIGLHILNKFSFKQGLHIYGQEGTKSILSQLIKKPFTAGLNDLSFKVTISELSEGVHHIPFRVECKWLLHSSPCLGYRFKIEDKIISYCTDTGFCRNAIKLAKGADLFITECSCKSNSSKKKWPHLDPIKAAKIAREAKAKKLVLTHFDAAVYLSLRERKQAQFEARKIFHKSYAANDNRSWNFS